MTVSSIQKQIKLLEAESAKSKNTDIASAETALSDLNSNSSELNDRRAGYYEEGTYNQAISEMLKDTGIKTKVIRQYLPVMNKLINGYLQVLDFFVSFIDLAMHQQQLPQVKTAVQDYASRRGVSVQVATDYLAAEFMAEAIWLAKAGAPIYAIYAIYEPLRWILRRTPRPQAAFAWTQIRQRVSRSSGPAWQQ